MIVTLLSRDYNVFRPWKVIRLRWLVARISEVLTSIVTKQKPRWQERHKRLLANGLNLRSPVPRRLGILFSRSGQTTRLHVLFNYKLVPVCICDTMFHSKFLEDTYMSLRVQRKFNLRISQWREKFFVFMIHRYKISTGSTVFLVTSQSGSKLDNKKM